AGQLMVGTGTLRENPQPYHLSLELARGKTNQVRNQASDWAMGGLELSDDLREEIHQACRAVGRAAVEAAKPAASAGQESGQAGGWAARAGQHLVQAYVDQVFAIRHERQAKLDTALGCRLSAVPSGEHATALRQAFNAISIPFRWSDIEIAESDYRWEAW